MIFTEMTNRNGYVHIDGYSNKKTVNGALKDLAREVAKYSELESKGLLSGMKDEPEFVLCYYENYKVECEEVGCATRYINDDENEYKEANFYLHIQYVE